MGRLGRVWEGPRLQAFVLLTTLFFGAELLAMGHAARRTMVRFDRTDRRLHQLALASCLVVLAIFWVALVEEALQPAFANWSFALGAGFMAAGAGLRGR